MLIFFVRTAILYVFVIFSLRLMGKRQIGEMQPSELVVSIMISDLATIPISDPEKSILSGIIPILTLVISELFISSVLLKSAFLRGIITGRPSIIVKGGAVLKEEMKKQRFNISDLTEQLRLQGYWDISEVDTVILETNGQLTIMPKWQMRQPNLKDLEIKSKQDKLPVILISEGKFVAKNLNYLDIEKEKIYRILKNNGIKSEKDVYFMSYYDNKYHIQKNNGECI